MNTRVNRAVPHLTWLIDRMSGAADWSSTTRQPLCPKASSRLSSVPMYFWSKAVNKPGAAGLSCNGPGDVANVEPMSCSISMRTV